MCTRKATKTQNRLYEPCGTLQETGCRTTTLTAYMYTTTVNMHKTMYNTSDKHYTHIQT